MPDPTPIESVEANLHLLEENIKAINEAIEAQGAQLEEEHGKTIAELRDKLADLEARALGAGADISAFFSSVASGMVDAQKTLDSETESYLAGGPPMQSVFRIPKVSAEFQFATSSLKEKKLGVIVYGTRDKQEQTQQQKISFDLVAAPPPVELARARHLWRQRVLTLDPTVRSQLEDAVAALPTSKLKATRKAYFTTAFDKVLIFEQDDRWVLVASRGARPDLDVIAFKRAGDEVRDFTVPRLAEDGALKPLPTHLLPLARFVKWLGEEQARWIKDLKRGGASQESSEG